MSAQILIVEDDWTLADGLRAALEYLGYGVVGVAVSGAEAIAAAGGAAPDLALMDVHLQGPMDGIETAGILRDRFRVPVVYLTSHFDDATLARARLTMPYGYLAKPFNERELHSTVEIALYKHALDARLAIAGRLAALGTLAAGLGHEINNPLTYVLGNLDFALDVLRRHGFADDANAPAGVPDALARDLREVAAVLAEAQQGALRVRDTVHSVKHFARVEESPLARVELREPLEEALRMTGVELRDRARLRVEYGPAPAVMANPARLQQVFVNLLLNASQAIADGAPARNEVCLRTRTDARGNAVIEVRDTGHGIAAADLPRIFEPFFTTRPVGRGAGLGLAICHGVVSSLGGEITVESEPGRGTVARVVLPAAPPAEAPLAPSAPATTAPARRGRVLVIDDEVAVARSIERVLRSAHDVAIETDPREALARIVAGESFDLVLCDLMMPLMSGIEFYEALSAARPAVSERVVFITGGAVSQRATEFLARQVRPHLAKPFSAESLRRVAADAMSAPTAH